ncbi:MAG TPA: hypothetical protein VGF75_08110 [Candidatus Saccharimonadales bacterium]|jgi:hypothetical protein
MSLTAVSATVTDPSGQAWVNGLISYSIAGTKPIFYDGTELPDNYFETTTLQLDSSGHASFNLPDCVDITPTGTLWRIIVNPNATSRGISLYLFVTGTTMDISAEITSAIGAPAVIPASIPFAYDDSNIILQVGIGELYYNTGNDTGLRVYTESGWMPVEGSGGGVPSVNGITGDVVIEAGANVTVTTNVGAGTVTIAATSSSGITALTGDVTASGTGSVAATALAMHPNTAAKGITWPSGDTITDTYSSDAGLALVTLGDFNFVANGAKKENIVGEWLGSFGSVDLSVSGVFVLGLDDTLTITVDEVINISGASDANIAVTGAMTIQGNSLALDSNNGEIDFSVNNGSSVLRKLAASTISDATGSRVYGTTYQNTSKQMMQVSGWGTTSGSSTGILSFGLGPSSAVTRWQNVNTASVSTDPVGFIFNVPPGWFYEINISGDISGTVGGWHEMLF